MHSVLLTLAEVLLVVMALLATGPCAYLLVLTLLSWRLPLPPKSSRRLNFDVIVPAHNEAAGIGRTISNLLRLDWPQDRFRLLVIADNCTDDTAEVARAAGAGVLVRTDTELRGKGYALAFAFERSRSEARADAVVVVDADSEASLNLLEAFASRIESGAAAVQAHYGVLNAVASWRTRLMAIALGSFHMLRSRGRERLRLSSGIRGNGWCVTHRLLEQVPYRAFSLAEDIEFGIAVGLNGHRVCYCDEARVEGEMVTAGEAARSQRQRWEGGRVKLMIAELPRLLSAAFCRRDAVCGDLAIDLMVLPLSYVALSVIALTFAGAIAWLAADRHLYLWLAVFDIAALFFYVLRGWQLSKVGARGLWDLALAPVYVAWKVLLAISGRKNQEWVRTEREVR